MIANRMKPLFAQNVAALSMSKVGALVSVKRAGRVLIATYIWARPMPRRIGDS
jgi:hypothetical protein